MPALASAEDAGAIAHAHTEGHNLASSSVELGRESFSKGEAHRGVASDAEGTIKTTGARCPNAPWLGRVASPLMVDGDDLIALTDQQRDLRVEVATRLLVAG
ncbi:MAG: hypothetical protein JRH20_30765 [Deltaproteobacteria bacterium]|nr:hypothetical protein [Deltaproteobacteria bacterium]